MGLADGRFVGIVALARMSRGLEPSEAMLTHSSVPGCGADWRRCCLRRRGRPGDGGEEHGGKNFLTGGDLVGSGRLEGGEDDAFDGSDCLRRCFELKPF